MNPNIFRLYDVRGKYPSELDEDVAYKIGTYFGSLCSGQDILVGCDGRLSSESLLDSIIQGINDSGGKVSVMKFVTTPVVYYADKIQEFAASIMITASHSPKDCNGFKMLLGGKPFFGDKLNELQKYINSAPDFLSSNIRDYKDNNFIIEQYIKRILEDISIDSHLTIAWDSGNGVSAKILEKLLPQLPNKNIHINSQMDGNFPDRSPDQMEHGSMDKLIKTVLDNKCDLGISFDGDGDRTIFVTSSGRVVQNDYILCIFAEDILKHNPDALAIADVKTSRIFFEHMKGLGGKTQMAKTGHAFIKDMIAKTGALFAGELSSHMFFADRYYGFDDGIYAGLRMIDLLTRYKTSLDYMIAKLPKSFVTGEIKIKVKDEQKFQTIEDIKSKMIAMGRSFIDIDGIRYESSDGWWLIRASNTESSIISRAESMSERGLKKVKDDLAKFLKF